MKKKAVQAHNRQHIYILKEEKINKIQHHKKVMNTR